MGRRGRSQRGTFGPWSAHSLTTIAALQGAIDCDTAGIDVFDTRDERMRLDNPYETTIAHRIADRETDGDSMGLAVRWYAENLILPNLHFMLSAIRAEFLMLPLRQMALSLAGPRGIFSGATSRGTAPAVTTNPVSKKANCDQSDSAALLGLGTV